MLTALGSKSRTGQQQQQPCPHNRVIMCEHLEDVVSEGCAHVANIAVVYDLHASTHRHSRIKGGEKRGWGDGVSRLDPGLLQGVVHRQRLTLLLISGNRPSLGSLPGLGSQKAGLPTSMDKRQATQAGRPGCGRTSPTCNLHP